MTWAGFIALAPTTNSTPHVIYPQQNPNFLKWRLAIVTLNTILLSATGAFAQSPAPGRGNVPANLPARVLEFRADLRATSVVPPTDSGAYGTGRFTLEESLLRGGILMTWEIVPVSASIHGPAKPGEIARAVLTLVGPVEVVPQGSFEGVAYPGGIGFGITKALSDQEVDQLKAGFWYVNANSAVFPLGEIRGQILLVPPDSDGDGVSDDADLCPDTPAGTVVAADGCSIDQLCPCSGPWKNHGHYVRAVTRTAGEFQKAGLINKTQRRAIVKAAEQSICGKRR